MIFKKHDKKSNYHILNVDGKTDGNFRYRFIKSNQIKFYSAFKQTNNNNNIRTYININTERAGKEVITCIVKGNFKDTKHIKQIEQQFIINFVSNKFGFNKDITYLSKYDTIRY